MQAAKKTGAGITFCKYSNSAIIALSSDDNYSVLITCASSEVERHRVKPYISECRPVDGRFLE